MNAESLFRCQILSAKHPPPKCINRAGSDSVPSLALASNLGGNIPNYLMRMEEIQKYLQAGL